MNLKSRLEMVKEFHKTFHLTIGKEPGIQSDADADLRVNLITEELNELKEALNEYEETRDKKCLVDVLDALADLEYVLLGSVISFGMSEIFNEAFEEVHSSNMSKLYKWQGHNDMDKEIEYQTEKNGSFHYGFYQSGKENYSIIKRSSDGKILKPRRYSPVNLVPLLKLFNNT